MSSHNFDVEKWQNMSIFAQMGNISSEVGRTAQAFQQNDQDSYDGALRRALDLFDATVGGLVKQKSPRLKEVLRAREVFTAQYFSPTPGVDPMLETYFMQFAIADRINR